MIDTGRAVEIARDRQELRELVGFKESSGGPSSFQPPSLPTRGVACQETVLDCRVEDVRQQDEGLVDRLVAERDSSLASPVTDRPTECSGGLDPLALDHLLAAVLVDERDGDR